MAQKLDNDQLNRLRQHGLHEDEMFHTKLNFFLVYESVFLGVVGLLYSRPIPPKTVLICFTCLGFILTIIWGYVQARHKYIFDSIRALQREVIPEYKLTMERREQVKWPISSNFLLAYVTPLLVAITWIVLFIFTITS